MNKTVDILIIGEGTYPYIQGGVSTWIHQLIEGNPEINFGLIFIGGQKDQYKKQMYAFPKNIVYFEEVFIFEEKKFPKPKSIKQNLEVINQIDEIHNLFRMMHPSKDKLYFLSNLISKFKLKDFLYSDKSWEYTKDTYFNKYENESFIDYWWTIRNIHIPIWNLFDMINRLPEIKVVHSPSTGYAGFLAGLIKISKNIPYILTEHGIYTKERKIDLMTSDWFTMRTPFITYSETKGNLVRDIWNNFFSGLGLFSYFTADKILSLYRKAAEVQISYGAPPEKTDVIPNGVDIKKLTPLIEKRKEHYQRICLIGRVVPIKDIKTFLKAMRIVVNKLPNAEGWIVGPTNEDESYYEECQNLTKTLGLNENVRFMGFQNILDIFDKISVNTLTSISEGMPLTILEGFAAGIPAVTTDVGSCKDLIFGNIDEEDIQIGQAGFVCKVADANCLAQAYINLLTDETLWKKQQQAAIKRVSKYYTYEKLISNYKKIYYKALNWQE